ncbi:MAG: 3-isopropylmalate dehydratase large subunit [Acidobacteriota bacterium]
MRALTLSEALLARAAGRRDASPGDLLTCRIDKCLATDITAPLSIEVFRKMGARRVARPESLILVNDHFVPAKDIASANFARAMREFAQEQKVGQYFEVGRSGICHALVAERGLVSPGEIFVGADSHTCTAGALGAFATGVGSTDLAAVWALGELWFRVPETVRVVLDGALRPPVTSKDVILKVLSEIGVDGGRYMAIEFAGDGLASLPMEARLTLCNMAVEAGAKAGLVPPDAVTARWVAEKGGTLDLALSPDSGARYAQTLTVELSKLEPLVAVPFLPSLVRPARELRGTVVDQVFIGSCTNGYLPDLRDAARILKGRKVADGVRLIVTPATQDVYLAAAREGILSDLVEAGAAVTTPTCGACLGGHMGVLGSGETALATTNRNFRGRMGDTSSRVYLANPLVAAATAVAGTISLPEDLP